MFARFFDIPNVGEGCDRLTTKPDVGEVVQGTQKRRVRSKRMKCPHISKVYNGTMWPVDSGDYMALDTGTSWERGCRDKVWWKVGMWGLKDRAAVNTYITFKRRCKPNYYRHGMFQKRLTIQLFHIARAQLPIGDVSAAYSKEEYDYTILWPNKVTNFRDPLPETVQVSHGERDKAPTAFPGHKYGKLKKKLTCFLCRKEGRFKDGSQRKDREGKRYKLYAKTSRGCETCNVPLCKNYNCWKDYHSGKFAGQQDMLSSTCWK